MIVFPDHSVQTEYTDPNGSVWEFNGTGWVRQCAGSPIVPSDPQIPSSFRLLPGSTYEAGVPSGEILGSPLVFDDDVYLVWYDSPNSRLGWVRYLLNPDGTLSDWQDKGTVTDGSPNTNWAKGAKAPFNIRIGNYAFATTSDGTRMEYYFRQTADKKLSIGELRQHVPDLAPFRLLHSGFVDSRGGLIIPCQETTNTTGVYVYRLKPDASGDLKFDKNLMYTHTGGSGYLVGCMETPYGYMLGISSGVSSDTCQYSFHTFSEDFGHIDQQSKYSVTHLAGKATYPRVAARQSNGLGMTFIGEIADGGSALCGSMVDEAGKFGSDKRDLNGSYVGGNLIAYGTAANKSLLAKISLDTQHMHGTGIGSTLGVYGIQNAQLSTSNKSAPFFPVDMVAEPFLANSSEQKHYNFYMRTSQFIDGNSATANRALVRTKYPNIWLANSSDSSGARIYRFESSEGVTSISRREKAASKVLSSKTKDKKTEATTEE